MTVFAAILAGYGCHLAYTSGRFGWSGLLPGPQRTVHERSKESAAARLGLAGLDTKTIAAGTVMLGLAGFGVGAAIFGSAAPGVVLGLFTSTAPIGFARINRERKVEAAQADWPRLIEEIRLLVGTVGHSIPQATFKAGARAPEHLRMAFAEAQREWLISTDFDRAMRVFKDLADHKSADVAAETLLMAHEIGGTDISARLAALAQDRSTDISNRRDAQARQSGARFARVFVLIVPIGMALAGLSIGDGREAYGTPSGQFLVVFALLLMITCWIWAGRIMKLPPEERVLR